MFDNIQLPLALIMEEILEWEKKEDKEVESNNNQQLGTTSEKSWIQKEKSERRFCIFLRLFDFLQ
mgnify:CR=1 FL=1